MNCYINPKVLFWYTNKTRVEYHMEKVKLDKDLSIAAKKHADYILDVLLPAIDKQQHHTLDGKNFDFFFNKDIKYTLAGENLATGSCSSKETIDGWMASEGHKLNILSPSWDKIGVGVTCKYSKHYKQQVCTSVQMFTTNRKPNHMDLIYMDMLDKHEKY